MSEHHKSHPEYGAMGIFAGYGEFDEEKPMTPPNADDDLVERRLDGFLASCDNRGGSWVILAGDIRKIRAQLAAAEADRDEWKRAHETVCERLNDTTELRIELMNDLSIVSADLRAAEARNEIARKALEFIQSFGCPVCGGDCSSANPPMHGCPMDEISRALRSQSSGGGNG